MKRKMYRNSKNKLVAGVLSGLADYFNQDVVFWRLGFVFFLLVTGFMPGVLMYLIAWIIIPEQPLIEPVNKNDYKVYE